MMSNIASIFTEKGATFIIDNKDYHIEKTDAKFLKVVDAFNDDDAAKIIALIDKGTSIVSFGQGKLTVENSIVKYGDRVLNDAITARILTMLEDGFKMDPLEKFLENLFSNPSFRAINELYGFLAENELPITDEGNFLAYKRVTAEFKDCWTGTFDNSVGSTVKEDRNLVDEDKYKTCSNGLHFCSANYLHNSLYGGSDNPIVIISINPRDVVSIPVDYNNSKGRCCEYKVIGIHTEAKVKEALETSVVSEDHFFPQTKTKTRRLVVGERYTIEELATLLKSTESAVKKRAARGISVNRFQGEYIWLGHS